MDPADFGALACPTFSRPFDHAYESYLRAVTAERFDYVLCPLFGDHDAKLSKSPIKYLEATAAGAVGIFSDTLPYRDVQAGGTGLKTLNDAWPAALEHSLQLSDEARRALFEAAREDILRRFTTESQVLEYLAAFEAGELHAALGSHDSPGGRACIAYFFHETLLGGATLHLLEHATILAAQGFVPLLCVREGAPVAPEFEARAREQGFEIVPCAFLPTVYRRDPMPDDESRAAGLAAWMASRSVRMVHAVTYCADVALAASVLGLPLVNTLHQHYAPPSQAVSGAPPPGVPERLVSAVHSSSLVYARKWQEELQAPSFAIRAPIGDEYFESFAARCQRPLPSAPTIVLSGTLQPRKGQLKAVRAVKILHDRGLKVRLILPGYDSLRPDYVQACKAEIQALGLQDQVLIPGFTANPREFYDQADYILCASDDESMPQTILKAMASGMRVVSTPVGGVTEMIKDGFSGVITDGFEAVHLADAIQAAHSMPEQRWRRMLETAHATARMVCSREVVAYQLLRLYGIAVSENRALRGTAGVPSGPSQMPGAFAEAVDSAVAAAAHMATPEPPTSAPTRASYSEVEALYEQAAKVPDFSGQTSDQYRKDIFQFVTWNWHIGRGIIEVGCFHGGASVFLAYLCKIFGWPFYTVDINRGYLEFTQKLLERLGLAQNAVFFLGTLEQFAEKQALTNAPALIVIDGNHDYDAVKADIACISKLSRRPHAAAFHDFSLRSHNPAHGKIFVDKAIYDSFPPGFDIRMSRIGVQFAPLPLDATGFYTGDRPSPTGTYWDREGSEGVIITLDEAGPAAWVQPPARPDVSRPLPQAALPTLEAIESLVGLPLDQLVPGAGLPREQLFVPQSDTLSGIAVVIGTHGRRLSGELNARVADPAAGLVLRDVTLDLATVEDNSPVLITFERLDAPPHGKLLLQLSTNAGWPVCAYEWPRSRPRLVLGRLVNVLRARPVGPPMFIYCVP